MLPWMKPLRDPQNELRKKSRIESPGNIVKEEEESDFCDEEVSLHVFANAPEWA